MDVGNVWLQRLAFVAVLVTAASSPPADEPPASERPETFAGGPAFDPSLASPLPNVDFVAGRAGPESGRWRLARLDDLERAPAVVPAHLVSGEPTPAAGARHAPGCRQFFEGAGSPTVDFHPTGVGTILRF